MITNPKQRYYLGENPYGGSIFGKENKYQNGAARDSEIVKQKNYYNSSQINPPARRQRSEEPTNGWVRSDNKSLVLVGILLRNFLLKHAIDVN